MKRRSFLANVSSVAGSLLLPQFINPVNAFSGTPQDIVIFSPKVNHSTPLVEWRKLIEAMSKTKVKVSLADEEKVLTFITRPIESGRLLILLDAGFLTQQLRFKIDEYIQHGGDILLIGDPSEGLSTGTPIGGGEGRYFKYVPEENVKGIAFPELSSTVDSKILHGSLIATTSWPQAKSERADNRGASKSLGRWINWMPMKRDDALMLGSIASSWIQGKNGNPGHVAIISHVGVSDLSGNQTILQKILNPILAYHQNGLVMLNAGSDAFHYNQEDKKFCGGRILNRGLIPRTVGIKYKIKKIGDTTDLGSSNQVITISPGEVLTWREPITAGTTREGDYLLQISISNEKGQILEKQHTRFSVSKLKPINSTKNVTVKHGRFWRDGQPWFCHGVHYWQPIMAGQPDTHFWLQYMMPALYDPDQVDSDLQYMSRAGLKSVVIPYQDTREASSVMDFLFRCEKYGMLCMMYLKNANPITYDLNEMEALIEAAHLDKQAALFALDLAWEPHLGPESDRKFLDKSWLKWVETQYGSQQKAIEVWNFSPISKNGQLRGPEDHELTEDGEWQVMVAAYRGFVDDRISEGYGRVTKKIKSICPDVLVGTRTGYGGTGSQFYDNHMPYDLVSGADHLDYISPEAYALGGDWSGFQNGILIVELARYAGRYSKPVVWMEYGASVLPHGETSWSPSKLNLEKQANYNRNIIRLIDTTQSDGSFAWWWPGGYRIGENSDIGLLDVTGAPRPAFEVLAKGVQSLVYKDQWKPDIWLPIDRDLHSRGLTMIINDNHDKFLQLLNTGKRVGFYSQLDGLSTKNFPLTGIGNVNYKGVGPLKGLNAEILAVETETTVGSIHSIERNDRISRSDLMLQPMFQLQILNTGRVSWSSDITSEGCVYIEISSNNQVPVRKAINKDIPAGSAFTDVISFDNNPGIYSVTLTSKRTGNFGVPFEFIITSDRR